MERQRLPPWHERQRLPNGRELLIRPIRPEDAEPLRAGFPLLQPEEVRHRFGYTMGELTPELAQRFTRVNPRSEFALVAAEPLPPGEALIGAIARISVDADERGGEFAILVSSHIANMGVGRYLMTRLVKWARSRRLQCLYGDVLETNEAMIALAQSLGFVRAEGESAGLVRMTLDLRALH